MTNSEILQDFLGEKCRCGNEKHARQSFCRACFLRLPQELKQRLYRNFGKGHEEAFTDASNFLGLMDSETNENTKAISTLQYPVIDATDAIITTIESETPDSEILLCFYKTRADLEKPNRQDFRIGVIKFARWKDVEVFFFLNSNLVNELGKSSKFGTRSI